MTTYGRLVFALLLLLTGLIARAQNAGVSWSAFTSGFGILSSEHAQLMSIAGQPFVDEFGGANGSFVSGFLAGLVVSGPFTGIGVGPSIAPLPTKFQVLQNYPNPFNPSTTIGFRVAGGGAGSGVLGTGSSWVKLVVYDMLGSEVAVLVNDKKEPGNYEVTWNANGMASGVYFYRIQVLSMDSPVGRDSRSGAGEFVETRQMILVR
jgi:Secretion system C-terminal sorting domain